MTVNIDRHGLQAKNQVTETPIIRTWTCCMTKVRAAIKNQVMDAIKWEAGARRQLVASEKRPRMCRYGIAMDDCGGPLCHCKPIEQTGALGPENDITRYELYFRP